MKKLVNFYIPLLGAIIFVVFGSFSFRQYYRYTTIEAQQRTLQERIREADMLNNNKEAVRMYKELPASIPEVQLRILQRQWSIALDLLHQINLAKFNRALQQDVPLLLETLREQLDEMKERCSILLTEHEGLHNKIAWRVYNLEGSTRLLTAFLVLETERNVPKATRMLKEAISDFKSAIRTVDSLQVNAIEKNIPRWNLELLYAKQQVRKLKPVKSESEQRMELKDNLEALIPEKGGYAPGEPIERKVKK